MRRWYEKEEKRQGARERERKGDEGPNERSRDEEGISDSPASRFHNNPISLRRFSIFTTSFELTADSVAGGHSKYSWNLGFTLAAHGKPNGKDAHRKVKSKRRRKEDGGRVLKGLLRTKQRGDNHQRSYCQQDLGFIVII